MVRFLKGEWPQLKKARLFTNDQQLPKLFVIYLIYSCFHCQKVLLGVIFKSENKSEEMLDILQQIRGYSPNLDTADQTVRKSIPIVGDQLTVERGVNVIQAIQNAYTPEEKLEGIHMEIADWHTAVTFFEFKGMQYF